MNFVNNIATFSLNWESQFGIKEIPIITEKALTPHSYKNRYPLTHKGPFGDPILSEFNRKSLRGQTLIIFQFMRSRIDLSFSRIIFANYFFEQYSLK